jgi:hypothetical protein
MSARSASQNPSADAERLASAAAPPTIARTCTRVRTVTPRLYRPIAVCLALVGQVVGTFGLPAARGSAHAPDAACGCCLADRSEGRCCCHRDSQPANADDELPPCCRAKKAKAAAVVWVVPNLRSKCHEPTDTVPGSIVPVSMPPQVPVSWSEMPTDAGPLSPTPFTLSSRSTPPDDPPPRPF